MAERDSKRIIRQWNREIEDEIRRDKAKTTGERNWRGVVWGALWVLWLGLLLGLVAHIKGLH